MVTVADIAEKANVSVSSVSRVLSGRGYSSSRMQERVMAAARELGYTPNRVAQSLKLNETKTIGLIIADVENFFYAQVTKGVEAVANEAGYHVVLCNTSDDPELERHYLEVMAGLRVDGLLITPTAQNKDKIQRLIDSGVPVVQVDRQVDGLGIDSVLVDHMTGAYQAVSHVIGLGHERIGILAGEVDVTSGRDRLGGYAKALSENGIDIDPALIHAGSFRRDTAREAVESLLRTFPRPTAIFAANNILAEYCMLSLREMDIHAPEDISVAAFDDHQWMQMLDKPLTAVAQPTQEISRLAAGLLIRRLASRSMAEPIAVLLEPTLRIRASTSTRPEVGTQPLST